MNGASAGTAYVRVAGDFNDLNSKLVGILSPSRLGKLGKIAGVALAGGIAAAGAVKLLYDVGKAFDDVYDEIRVKTGATGKELEGLKGSFREVVRAVPADFETAGKAIAGLNQRLGLTGKPLSKLTKQFTELSRITDTDIEENVAGVTRAFGDWEVKQRKQSKTLDIFFRASQSSGAAVSDLAQQVVQFGAPLRQVGFELDEAVAMFAAFEQAGVNTQTMMPGLRFALRSFLEEGLDPKKELQKTFDGITKGAIDSSEAFEVFGGRATPDMIEAIKQGRFELDDLTETIRKGDDTIRKAGRQTMDFSEHWLKFKNNVLLTLEPVATRVFEGIGDAMKDVTKIMSDPDLSNAEKFERLRDLAVDALSDLISKAAEIAPKVISALAQGLARAWGDMNPLGKLLTGAALIRMIGGRGALLGTGARIGGFLGLGIASGASTALAGGAAAGGAGAAVAGGAASGGILGKLKSIKWARVGGLGIGIALADGVLSEFGRRAATKAPDIFEALEAKSGGFKPLGLDIGGVGIDQPIEGLSDMFGGTKSESRALLNELEKIQDRTAGITDAELAHVHALARAADLTDEQADQLDAALAPAIELSQRVKGKMSLDDVANDWGKNLRKMAGLSKREMGNIRDVLDKDSERGTALLSKHFDQAVVNIKDAMREGRIGTERGARMIERVLREQLELYGLSDSVIDKSVAMNQKGRPGKAAKKGQVSPGGIQRGGPIDEGAPAGDSVPAMLERGEYVLNREAAKGVGRQVLDQINFGAFSRFAKGGIVGLGKKLQKQGFLVGEHPAFGGVAPPPTHVATSHHYDGTAIDVNWPTPGGPEMAKLDALYARLKGMPGVIELLWRVANHFDHLHVAMTGGAGKLGDLGGGMLAPDIKLPRFSSRFPAHMPGAEGLNRLAEGLEKKAGKAAQREGAEALPGGKVGGWKGINSPGEFIPYWNKVNPDQRQWASTFSRIVPRESTWNPRAENFIGLGHRGWYQFDPPTWAGFGRGSWANAFNPALATAAAGNVMRQEGASGLGRWAATLQRGGFVDLWGKGLQHLAPGGIVGPGGSEGRGGSGGGGKGGKDDKRFKLGKSLDQITRLDELIDLATRSAMLPGSPAGEELAAGERSKQVRLTKKLLGALIDRRGGLKGLLRNKGLKGPRRQVLEDFLAEMQGVTGKGGRIFDTREALEGLRATPAAESERLDEINSLLREKLRLANVRAGIAERQFDVFKSMPPYGGSFAGGGVVPGPVGAPRTITAHGGEQVGTGDVAVYLHGDLITDRRDPVEVVVGDRRFRAKVEQINRGQSGRGRRPLPGRAGVLG